MSKKYFIWKDRNCNGVNPEWVELSGSEFYQFIKNPENKTRRFEVFNNRICDDADILAFEVTEERYREFCKVKRHERYLDENSQGYFSVSMQENFLEDEELTFDEIIADKDVDVEEVAIKKANQKALLQKIQALDGIELETINLILLSYQRGISERELCRQKGIPHTTFLSRKQKIFEKIKKSFDQNGYFLPNRE